MIPLNSHTTDIEQHLKRSIKGEVRFDPYSRAIYSTDASIYKMKPMGVILPRSAEDVQASVELLHSAGITLVPRGGGTSLSGQTVNTGVVMDFSKYMNSIIDINPQEQWVTTQPGITIDELNRQLKLYGLFFTTDPSTSSRANIGGAIGNNSCGARSIVYGKTVDHVLELSVVLSDGTMTVFKPLSNQSLQQISHSDTLEGKIYKDVYSTVSVAKVEVEKRFPKILRRVGGYNLDLLNIDNLNMSKLIVGSEGTLASVVSAKLNLEKIPEVTALLILHFKSLKAAMDTCLVTLEHNPHAVEHIGSMIISQAKKSIGFKNSLDFIQGNPSDILVVEVSGESIEEVNSKCNAIVKKISKTGCYASTMLTELSDKQNVWSMRKAGLGLMMNLAGDAKPIPFVEDTAVSPERLPEYVERFDQIVKQNGTEAGYYGHASVGCMHIRPVINLKTQEGIDRMERISSEIADLVLEFNGSLTGEHGDGIVRGHWANKMFGDELVQHFRDVKKSFDPKGIMNPGKIFDTPPLTQNLRYGTDYSTLKVNTLLDFSKEGGFAKAVEKCNGVGECRKLTAGAMCPSYMATREEEHSTRGRANALRAALSGVLPEGELHSKRMNDVLDLCLECKSCKTECPSNVDMAKIKYEFLHSYYKNGGKIPLRSRIVANIHLLNRLMCGYHAPLANFVIRSKIGALLQQRFGIHKYRKLPRIANKSFASQFRNKPSNTSGSRGEILFFNDTFTNFNHPESGIAAIRLLEAMGYIPIVVSNACCGRPMISKGFLEQARKYAMKNVELLYPYVKSGMKIVGVESSCISTLLDEYPDLLPKDPRAKLISESVSMIEDILLSAEEDSMQKIEWTDTHKSVKLFVHCHQRALTGKTNALRALNLPTNYNTQMLNGGCCGMAGSFGFEREHYKVSMKIGEDRLFPEIRLIHTSQEVAITGTSCKQQIEDGTSVIPKFLSQILADALP